MHFVCLSVETVFYIYLFIQFVCFFKQFVRFLKYQLFQISSIWGKPDHLNRFRPLWGRLYHKNLPPLLRSSYKTWHTQSSGTDNFGDFQGSNPISSSTLFGTMLEMFLKYRKIKYWGVLKLRLVFPVTLNFVPLGIKLVICRIIAYSTCIHIRSYITYAQRKQWCNWSVIKLLFEYLFVKLAVSLPDERSF